MTQNKCSTLKFISVSEKLLEKRLGVNIKWQQKKLNLKKNVYLFFLFKCIIINKNIIITTISCKYAFKFHYDIFVTS